jgi:hypothetical protein
VWQKKPSSSPQIDRLGEQNPRAPQSPSTWQFAAMQRFLENPSENPSRPNEQTQTAPGQSSSVKHWSEVQAPLKQYGA